MALVNIFFSLKSGPSFSSAPGINQLLKMHKGLQTSRTPRQWRMGTQNVSESLLGTRIQLCAGYRCTPTLRHQLYSKSWKRLLCLLEISYFYCKRETWRILLNVFWEICVMLVNLFSGIPMLCWESIVLPSQLLFPIKIDPNGSVQCFLIQMQKEQLCSLGEPCH